MISNAKLKQFASFRLAKNCAAENVFVVEGEKMAYEALLSGLRIRALCATDQWLADNSEKVAEQVSPYDIYEVSDAELERLSNMQTPNKVWLLVQTPEESPLETALGGLSLVLDRIQDPGNMGTILRIADWFGVRHVVCSHDTVNYLNPKVVQASMGSVFRTQVHYAELETFLTMSHNRGIAVYGALLDGVDIYHAETQSDAVLVIGNESKGISKELERLITHKISIPNYGGTCESLNASVAAGILCAEFRRR
ncbi:MAG: RNA methyltransferase, partial [Bacteroidales bacterium]|nr:RNA methyltransferase [Bacteroidales bacterium]